MKNPEIHPASLEHRAEARLAYVELTDKIKEMQQAKLEEETDKAKILEEECDVLFMRVLELDPEFAIAADMDDELLDSILKDYAQKMTIHLHEKKH